MSEMTLKSEYDIRIDWIDKLRGIGIILVFLGHEKIDAGLKIYIYSFHMPLFFFLSGLVASATRENMNFRHFFLKKVRTRLVPYISFGLITYLLWIAPRIIKWLIGYTSNISLPEGFISPIDMIIGLLYGSGTDQWLIYNILLWFLPCLFVTELLAFVLTRISKKTSLLLLCIISLAIAGYVDSQYMPFRMPFGGDVALIAAVFYLTAVGLHPRSWTKYVRVVGRNQSPLKWEKGTCHEAPKEFCC
ncbi:MAG: acyltransferase family protein [Smithella sp.]